MAKILAFSGSSRQDSFNQKLVKVAAQGAESAGAQVTVINLADYPMPIFNQDLEDEQGMPEKAHQFKQLMIQHDGFLIASPEYNSTFSPLLKNVIDWASRAESPDEPSLIAFKGKVAAIMSASPGALGGIRGLVFLRMMLANIGMIVLPGQQAIANAHHAFNQNGSLNNDSNQDSVLGLGRKLAGVIDKIKA